MTTPSPAPSPRETDQPLDRATGPQAELVLHGTGAALGHAIEKAVVITHGAAPKDFVIKVIDAQAGPAGVSQFENALVLAKTKLEQVQQQASSADQRDILEFQVMALADRTLIPLIKSYIAEGVPVKKLPAGTEVAHGVEKVHVDAPTAVTLAFNANIEKMRGLADPYFAARAADIEAVRDLILSLLTGGTSAIDAVAAIKEPSIIVADKLTPGQAAALKKEFVLGIVTSGGTKNDHVAVIAKSLGIPLVVGADISGITTGTTLLVDGDRGLVVVNPTASSICAARAEMETLARTTKKLSIATRAPKTKDGELVTLAATMDTVDQQAEILKIRAHGIGLFRTEWMHLGRNQILGEDEQFAKYAEILKAFSPNPVVFRIMDLGADKVLHSANAATEANPALGARGIRLALHQKEDILIPQIRAILRASVFGEARILIPMVNDVGEIAAVRQIIAEQSAKLTEQKLDHDPKIKLGAMIETPAAAIGAFRIFRECDFANVGSNDMTQYTLALDRENPLVAHHYHPHAPALIEMYRTIARKNMAEATDAGRDRRPLLLCGDASSNVLMLPVFIGLGYRGFSVPPPMVEELNYRLSLLDSAKCVSLVEALRDPKTGPGTPDGVYERLLQFQESLTVR